MILWIDEAIHLRVSLASVFIHIVLVHIYLWVLILYPGLITIPTVVTLDSSPHYHFSVLWVIIIYALLVDLLMDYLSTYIYW